MKTIEEIFEDFYQNHLRNIDKSNKIKDAVDKKNYQFVLGYASVHDISLPQDILNATLYLNFKLLRSRQIGCEGEKLFKLDYENTAGKDSLEKMSRGDQDQLNPDYLEKNKNKYLEIKTATIYKGNKFIFEQIRLKDIRIDYYIFLGITPEGRFYLVLDKNDMPPGKIIYGAKLSPQHSTKDTNATYQWHPSYKNIKEYIVKPDQLGTIIK